MNKLKLKLLSYNPVIEARVTENSSPRIAFPQ